MAAAWIVVVGGAWAASAGVVDPSVRVLLLESTGAVRIEPAGGATRVVEPGRGAGLRVDGTPSKSPLRFGEGAGVTVEGLRYRGFVEVHRRGAGLAIVNEVPLEDYVAGTLHRELHPDWNGAALRAQAVATRTYALYRLAHARDRLHHLEASTGDQVYGGGAAETPAARQAVRDTRGQALFYGGTPILAAFHSAAGGRTASAEEVWGRPLPYLRSLEVAGEDLSPDAYWRVRVSGAQIGRALAASGEPLGMIRDVVVLERTPSGRVARVSVQGSQGRAELSGRRLRQALGLRVLRSTLYEVRRDGSEAFVFVGSGHGHGVGMSQWGARAMARGGASYREILARFYPGAELRRIGEDLPVVAAGGAER